MPSHTPTPPPETATKTTTSSRLNCSSVISAITALLNWAHRHSSSPSTIYLILTLKKTPHAGRRVTHKLTLPFPIYPSISLLVPNHLFNNTNTNIVSIPKVEVRVLPASELSSLAGSRRDHSSCLINCLIVKKNKKSSSMHKKTKSSMVSVDMSREGWREEVEMICRTTELCFAQGNCRAVRVGHAEMGKEEVVENVVAAVEEAVRFVPKKWKNVRALHVKTPESLALPIYEALAAGHGGGGEDGGGNEEEKKSKKRKLEQ